MERPIVWNKHGVGPESCLSVEEFGCSPQRVRPNGRELLFGEASTTNLTRMSASLSVNWVHLDVW